MLVVGDAVKKAAKLGWFESRALYGWQVLVPRTRDQAGALSVHDRFARMRFEAGTSGALRWVIEAGD